MMTTQAVTFSACTRLMVCHIALSEVDEITPNFLKKVLKPKNVGSKHVLLELF